MNATHTRALLITAQAVPFTVREAIAADANLMGRYSRRYLQAILKARSNVRACLRAAIMGGHYLQAIEHATMAHSYGVQAVMLIRRNARHTHV
jgi:hypothetical protein